MAAVVAVVAVVVVAAAAAVVAVEVVVAVVAVVVVLLLLMVVLVVGGVGGVVVVGGGGGCGGCGGTGVAVVLVVRAVVTGSGWPLSLIHRRPNTDQPRNVRPMLVVQANSLRTRANQFPALQRTSSIRCQPISLLFCPESRRHVEGRKFCRTHPRCLSSEGGNLVDYANLPTKTEKQQLQQTNSNVKETEPTNQATIR